MTNDKAMQFWHFHEAPKEYRDLSGFGGDEDYLVFVPEATHAPYWMQESGLLFARSDVREYNVEGGMVYISAHS